MKATVRLQDQRPGPHPLRLLLPAILPAMALIGIAATARPAVGQDAPSMRFHITADAGMSVQESFGAVRFGRDLVTYGLRLTAARRGRLHPWIDGAHFTRPDFECVSGLQCNDAGWLARAGVATPLSQGDPSGGLTVEARAGAGAAFADDTSLSYLLGFALVWHALPRIAPSVEFRWEHVTGINRTLLAAGIRIDL